MGKSREEAVKEIQNIDAIFVAYSQATKLPYVTCDEETFNDQAWIFSTEEGIKEFGKKLLEDKMVLMGMRYEKKDYPRFYGILYSLGINSVVWNTEEETIEIELPYIAKQADLSKIAPEQRPLLNPTLQLSGMYFMQEMKRPVKPEERKNVRELEEELLANLMKSEFLMAVEADPEHPEKFRIPFLKNKEGKAIQPVFSDVLEYDKFAKGKTMRVTKVAFSKLQNVFMEQTEALAINPMGFNLVLTKEQLKRISDAQGKNE